jgi:guanine deaminase
MCLAAVYWARIPKLYYANTRADAAVIGFDDDFIYDQLQLPPEKRAVAMQTLLRDEAQEGFRTWQTLANKIEY